MALNARKVDSAAEIFYLKLRAGDQDALAIKQIVNNAGLTLGLKGRASGLDNSNPKSITCIGALEYIYKFGHQELLRKILSLSCTIWPNDYQGRRASVLRGLQVFLTKYPDVNEEGVSG